MNKQLDLSNTKVYSNTKEDIIKALTLIGEDVYMSDTDDFSEYDKGKLVGVRYASDDVYTDLIYLCRNVHCVHYKYIILCKDAKFKEEKKLRPYKNISEFFDKFDFNIGDVITIKRINCEYEYEDTILFIGFRITGKENQKYPYIFLGQLRYTFEDLMNNFLYYKDGRWHSFGIEE